MLHRDRDEVVAGERHLAGEQLVEHDAERVDVGVRVDVAALRLLGRDVVAGAEDGAGLGLALGASIGRAIPKSVTFASPLPFRSTFCGLTSRWTKPFSCANASPRAISIAELEHAVDRRAARSRPTSCFRFSPGDVLEDDERAAVVVAAVDHGDDVVVREAGDQLAPRG